MNDEKPKILVIEDNEEEGNSIKTILEVLGGVTYLARSLGEVKWICQQNLPDLVLLDLGIQSMDSYEAAKIVREHFRSSRVIPILFLTEIGCPNVHRIEIFNWEATDSLNRPYYPFELVSRCRTLLHFKRYEVELEMAEQVLLSLALAVEARDPTSGNHCDRLVYHLSIMSDALGFDREARDALLKGATLHDIGKVGVPDNILLKKGPLTDREWEVMRQHVIIGESLCRPLRFLHPVLPLIRHHHERFSGLGYPDGLKGGEIPLIARVFQVCDVYDALTHKRPYKPAYEETEAVRILQMETEAGSWDPYIVETFLKMLDEEVSQV